MPGRRPDSTAGSSSVKYRVLITVVWKVVSVISVRKFSSPRNSGSRISDQSVMLIPNVATTGANTKIVYPISIGPMKTYAHTRSLLFPKPDFRFVHSIDCSSPVLPPCRAVLIRQAGDYLYPVVKRRPPWAARRPRVRVRTIEAAGQLFSFIMVTISSGVYSLVNISSNSWFTSTSIFW